MPSRKFPLYVYMAPRDMEIMFEAAAQMGTKEIGGCFKVTERDDGVLVGSEPAILKQEVSGGECDFAQHVGEWIRQHHPDEYAKEMPNVNFGMWHSHANMGTFLSGQDEEWISNYVNRGWLVSIVVNTKREHTIRTDTLVGHGNKESELYHVKCDTRLYVPLHDYGVKEAVKAAIEANVTIKAPVSYKSVMGGRHSIGFYGDSIDWDDDDDLPAYSTFRSKSGTNGLSKSAKKIIKQLKGNSVARAHFPKSGGVTFRRGNVVVDGGATNTERRSILKARFHLSEGEINALLATSRTVKPYGQQQWSYADAEALEK